MEALALLVIAIGAVEAAIGIFRIMLARRASDADKRAVWLGFARWLVAGLTFQLAADIVHTTVTPGWDEIGRVAAIAAIRTFLTFFLDRDIELRIPASGRERCKAHLTQLSLIGYGAIFTLFFITLGPLKILGPFAQLTRETDEATMRKIAVRAFVLAVIAVVAGGLAGRALLEYWGISSSAMLLSGGIIFALVGLSLVLEQYQPAHPAPPPLPAVPMAAAMRITFPTVVTPYGIAALIVVLTNSRDAERTGAILALLLAVMVLNLLTMLYGRRIMGGVTVMVLQVIGAVLGVLQVAIAVDMILRALRELGVLHG